MWSGEVASRVGIEKEGIEEGFSMRKAGCADFDEAG